MVLRFIPTWRMAARHGQSNWRLLGVLGAGILVAAVLLAAAQAEGITEIRHAACEPHVAELCRLLELMGARVEGIGTSTIRRSASRS